jgi:hypothetical protein
MNRIFLSGLSLLILSGLSACGSDRPEPPVSTGQQLIDLQDAYRNRAITPDEYEEQKEDILDR